MLLLGSAEFVGARVADVVLVGVLVLLTFGLTHLLGRWFLTIIPLAIAMLLLRIFDGPIELYRVLLIGTVGLAVIGLSLYGFRRLTARGAP